MVGLRPGAEEFQRPTTTGVARSLAGVVLGDAACQIIGDAAVKGAVLAQEDVETPFLGGLGFGGCFFLLGHRSS